MSKLSPKPTRKKLDRSWKSLDSFLQNVLSDPLFDFALVDLKLYNMDKQDILSELNLIGYDVTDKNNGYLEVRL